MVCPITKGDHNKDTASKHQNLAANHIEARSCSSEPQVMLQGHCVGGLAAAESSRAT